MTLIQHLQCALSSATFVPRSPPLLSSSVEFQSRPCIKRISSTREEVRGNVGELGRKGTPGLLETHC